VSGRHLAAFHVHRNGAPLQKHDAKENSLQYEHEGIKGFS
jgi:hypothetical protein